MKIVRLFCVAFIFIIFAFSDIIRAENSNHTFGTIIFDFTNTNGNSGPLAYLFFKKNMQQIITDLGENADTIIVEKKGIEAFLKKLKDNFSHKKSSRWISKEKYNLAIYVFYHKEGELKPKISIEENERKTRLAGDISKLSKIMFTVYERDKRKKPEATWEKITYQLEKSRALLIITVNLSDEKTKKLEIITGPSEHWFLSTDLLVRKLSSVKFVNEPYSIEPRETPKKFYLGANLMIGDILSDNQHPLKNFHIKCMILISKNPLDSYGIGIGYRLPKLGWFGADFSVFSIYASMIWAIDENEVDGIENIKKRQILFGISYNLDKALGWLK